MKELEHRNLSLLLLFFLVPTFLLAGDALRIVFPCKIDSGPS